MSGRKIPQQETRIKRETTCTYVTEKLDTGDECFKHGWY